MILLLPFSRSLAALPFGGDGPAELMAATLHAAKEPSVVAAACQLAAAPRARRFLERVLRCQPDERPSAQLALEEQWLLDIV